MNFQTDNLSFSPAVDYQSTSKSTNTQCSTIYKFLFVYTVNQYYLLYCSFFRKQSLHFLHFSFKNTQKLKLIKKCNKTGQNKDNYFCINKGAIISILLTIA